MLETTASGGWGPHSRIKYHVYLCMKITFYINVSLLLAQILSLMMAVDCCANVLCIPRLAPSLLPFFFHTQALPVTRLWRPSTRLLHGSSLLWKTGPWAFVGMPRDVAHASPSMLVPCKSHHFLSCSALHCTTQSTSARSPSPQRMVVLQPLN